MLIARAFPGAQLWCSSPEGTWQESARRFCALLWHRCVLHCIALHVVCMQVFSEVQLVLSSSVGLENISCLPQIALSIINVLM